MNRLPAHVPRALVLLISSLLFGVLLVPTPATASVCAPGTGVTVVVGSDARCAGGGGRSAASAFGATGHSLTRVQRFPGAVCQVDGYPSTSCVNMPPDDAYWGLFWSNGRTGNWTFASSGVDSLSIPKGGSVGFAFQNGSGRTYPRIKPPVTAAAKPKSAAKSKPSAAATPTNAGPASTPPPTKSTPSPDGTATTGAAPETVSDETPASASSSSGALGWVAAAVMIALLLGMWAAMWRRRRAS